MSTISTLASGETGANSRTIINTNFTNLNNDKIETSVLDTDTTLAANSDLKVPTQKAVKAYVDSGGNQNASTTQAGIVEEATQAEIIAKTAAGGTGARLYINPSYALLVPPVVRVYTANATWTKPSGLAALLVEVQGGGGGGGGSSATNNSGGAGGGGGGYVRKFYAASSLASTEAVVVGAAGTAGTTTGNGGTGGDSTFSSGATLLTASGGVGGNVGAAAAAGGAGGAASGGDINIPGQTGRYGNSGFTPIQSGDGGNSQLGYGAPGVRNGDVVGVAAIAYGGGGSGGTRGGNSSAGGAGTAGVVIVTEFY